MQEPFIGSSNRALKENEQVDIRPQTQLAPAVPAWLYRGKPRIRLFQPAAAADRGGAAAGHTELLGGHHLNYWWSFVCQHQRPGIDIHADQSDISLNFWITPDSANLQPGTGGLDVWDVAAPADWTFDDYNSGVRDIRAFLRQEGARQTSYAYAENRALLFRGSIFHQTAATRFAEGFENRRRNVTMLFRRTHG